MAITIRELSKRCGLSISTVSKALNGYTDISEATRERVIEEARITGYYPNLYARALKTKRTYNLGVLFADDQQSGLTHPYFSYVLESFKKEAERHGYDVTFISHNIGETQMTYLEHCQYREVDGVCIACIDFLQPEVAQLINGDMHVVTIEHMFSNRTCIQSDNISGVRDLTRYVYVQGHRRIANIHGQRSVVTDTRLGSFYRAMGELGLSVPDEYVIQCEYSDPVSVHRAVDTLLDLKNRPTCILIADDFASFGAYDAIRERGLQIPEDISIAGYDGIPVMQLMRPRLTTIRQDAASLGAEAARRLVGLIENPKTAIPEIVKVPCSLIKGETVAAIKA